MDFDTYTQQCTHKTIHYFQLTNISFWKTHKKRDKTLQRLECDGSLNYEEFFSRHFIKTLWNRAKFRKFPKIPAILTHTHPGNQNKSLLVWNAKNIKYTKKLLRNVFLISLSKQHTKKEKKTWISNENLHILCQFYGLKLARTRIFSVFFGNKIVSYWYEWSYSIIQIL